MKKTTVKGVCVWGVVLTVALCIWGSGRPREPHLRATANHHHYVHLINTNSTSNSIVTNQETSNGDDWPLPDRRFSSHKDLVVPGHGESIPILYQCDGPAYTQFTGQLKEFTRAMIQNKEKPVSWGSRQQPLPANRNILFFGNSHTRQLALALMDQHGDEIVAMHNLARPIDVDNPRRLEMRFDLQQNTTVYLMVNSFLVHSPDWHALLEERIQRPLESLDAIVWGLFNSCRTDINTTYADNWVRQAVGECIQAQGPTLANVTNVYKGPLALVPMFSQQHADQTKAGQATIRKISPTRDNMAFIDARRYITALGKECGATADADAWTDCAVDESRARKSLHRCTGKHGGHADLVAWDVVDVLLKSVQSSSASASFQAVV